MNHKIKIGSHVGMSGKDMFLGSVREAITYGSNTFMIYTGAPQNTKRKKIEELNIEAGLQLMREHGIEEFIVHAWAHEGYFNQAASPVVYIDQQGTTHFDGQGLTMIFRCELLTISWMAPQSFSAE